MPADGSPFLRLPLDHRHSDLHCVGSEPVQGLLRDQGKGTNRLSLRGMSLAGPVSRDSTCAVSKDVLNLKWESGGPSWVIF